MIRPLAEADRAAFATLHADPEVMADQGGPLSRAESDWKFDRYRAAQAATGLSRQAVVDEAGVFFGYCGVMACPEGHPLAPALQIGWRLQRAAWGQGLATMAARQVIASLPLRDRPPVFAFTAPSNLRSRAVMARLGLHRVPERDFTTEHGLAWVWAVPVAGDTWEA